MKYMKRYAISIGCVLLISLLVVIGNGRGNRHWNNIHHSRLSFFDGAYERSGEQYGDLNEGPALTLPAGTYTLSWDIETDGANAIRIETTNDAAISPSSVNLIPGESTGAITLDAIDQIYNLQLIVSYQSGSYIRVNRIDLTGNQNTDRVWTLIIILAAAAILNILYVRGFLTPRRRGELLILAVVVLIASAPALKDNLNGGHDGYFHVDRLLNMLNALRSGQFPARLGAYMQNQYGAVTSAYYPELFLYIPAAMMLCGASLNFAMHVFLIGINAATALLMRYSAGKLFKNAHAGMLASILYTLAAYRLTDMYTRFSIGEALAMTFVPLFLYALYEVVWGDKKKWKLLALAAMFVYQSHLISAVICALIAAAACLLCAVKMIREHRLSRLILAGITAFSLCLYALIPLYTYNQQGVSTAMMARWTSGHLLAPAQLLLSMDPVSIAPSDATLKDFSLVIGLPLILSTAAALHTILTREKHQQEDILAGILAAAGILFALMTTTLFPWARLESLTHYAAAYIQFPWRLLMMSTICFSLAGGWGIAQLAKNHDSAVQFAVFALCAALALPLLSAETRKEGYTEAGNLPAWDQIFEDYTLKGTVVRETKDKTVHTTGDVSYSNYHKFGTRITAQVSSAQGGEISFPLFAFDGYEATLDGDLIPISYGDNNRISLTLPAGTSGKIQICFVGNPLWRIGEVISLLTAFVLILHTQFRYKKKTR